MKKQETMSLLINYKNKLILFESFLPLQSKQSEEDDLFIILIDKITIIKFKIRVLNNLLTNLK